MHVLVWLKRLKDKIWAFSHCVICDQWSVADARCFPPPDQYDFDAIIYGLSALVDLGSYRYNLSAIDLYSCNVHVHVRKCGSECQKGAAKFVLYGRKTATECVK